MLNENNKTQIKMASVKSHPNLPADSVILRNLKRPSYKMSVQSVTGRVTCATSHDQYVFVGVAGKGVLVFSVENDQGKFEHQIGCPSNCRHDATSTANYHDNKVTCHETSVSAKHIVYIKDFEGQLSICVHLYSSVMSGDYSVLRSLDISRKAPFIVDHQLDIIAIGCSAWSVSWTTDKTTDGDKPESNESHIRTIDIATLETLREWKATDNAVSLLRRQTTEDHNMLGVADTRTGLKVYDLKQPTDSDYVCLYQVPVEEIRNFHLVGNFVAVFHKFEPNVTFWNMKEQKTILCINIQDQMRELAEEFLEDEDEDCGLYGDDDDHVTCVTSLASDEDYILLYGTKSGCVFGMSVNRRLKLFNIPCPHEIPDSATPPRRGIQGLRYLSKGQLAVVYENYGLTLLDFNLENPPDRPPTRCQKRV